MCLAVPGEILEVSGENRIERRGRVRFGGIVKEINLAFVPEATIGDYVVVHAGFAISRLDDGEAQKILKTIGELGNAGRRKS